MRQDFGQHFRHEAFLEMAREQCEAHEQTQKVGKNYPFVADMRDEPGSACTGFEACEKNLVDDDCRETDERHAQRMVMKKRDAQQS